jgi:hypothetical protein
MSLVKFDEIKAEVEAYLAPIQTLTVTDKASEVEAHAVGKQVKFFLKRIEDTRAALVAPHLAAQREINEAAKGYAAPLLRAEEKLKRELAIRHEAVKRQEEEARRKLEAERAAQAKREAEERAKFIAEQKAQEAAAKKEQEEIARELGIGMTPEQCAQVEFEQEQARIKARNEFETQQAREKAALEDKQREISEQRVKNARERWVFEITDESLLPREFLMANEKRIREHVSLGARSIPGVRITKQTSVALGG